MQVNLFSGQDPSLPFSSSHMFKSQLMEEGEGAGYLGSAPRDNNNHCKDIFTFTATNAQSKKYLDVVRIVSFFLNVPYSLLR
jgi:hypothetical protein